MLVFFDSGGKKSKNLHNSPVYPCHQHEQKAIIEAMITLTLGDFIILFLMNLGVSAVVTYVVNYAKRKAELSAEEGSNDKEYLKKAIREAVTETRSVLTELRVQEFRVPTGKRRLSRMNSLVEKLSLTDTELGTKVWRLVNAPVMLSVAEETDKKVGTNSEVAKFNLELKNGYFEDLEWALQRCAELEKNPIA